MSVKSDSRRRDNKAVVCDDVRRVAGHERDQQEPDAAGRLLQTPPTATAPTATATAATAAISTRGGLGGRDVGESEKAESESIASHSLMTSTKIKLF